mmetsp:Transcript_46181/g.86180  ORF Transcript_46181/g.86180 Transcript_46181/m.86180 type:complete len:249 (+) Transcript_46181:619-1365(+)
MIQHRHQNLLNAPSDDAQLFAAVYTWWNILDRIAATFNDHRMIYGYMRETQLIGYVEVIREPAKPVKTYCEIGVNVGHGTVAMLLADPKLKVHSFDKFDFKFSKWILDTVKAVFVDRIQFHIGDSRRTLPEYVNTVQRGVTKSCDVLLVDGDHSYEGALIDIRNFANVAACNSTLLIDDIHEGPGRALHQGVEEGLVNILEWHMYQAGDFENPCIRVHLTNTDIARGIKPYKCLKRWGWAKAEYRNRC